LIHQTLLTHLSILDRIPQSTNLGTKINLHYISRLQELWLLHRIPDTRTCACHENRPLLQRSALTTITHQRRNFEAQIINARILSQIPVNNSLEVQFGRIRDDFGGYELGTQRRVGIEAF
jgi:hypothetical protein